jgi:hypothetical protein
MLGGTLNSRKPIAPGASCGNLMNNVTLFNQTIRTCPVQLKRLIRGKRSALMVRAEDFKWIWNLFKTEMRRAEAQVGHCTLITIGGRGREFRASEGV